MTPWMRKIHKWVGLIVGIQFVLWMASGVMMSVLDADQVHGHAYRVHQGPAQPWPENTLPLDDVLARHATPVPGIATGWLLGRPVYLLGGANDVQLVDAVNGNKVVLDAGTALKIAAASYSGDGQPGVPRLVARTLELRSHDGPMWIVDYADAEDTTVYLSAQTGAVLEHRNRTWRLFDLFWMLHIMDYVERKDFNNSLVVTSAVGGLWIALTGVWLLFASFRLAEFVPERWRGKRALNVYAPDGAKLRELLAPAGETVFAAMANQGIRLPSNCGGGQSCGLCAVRLIGAVPAPTSADRQHLSPEKIDSGFRLACNLTVDRDLQVEVLGGDRLWTEHGATVAGIREVTPFLREIVLRPDVAPGPEFRPGAYVQLHIPEYAIALTQISLPEHHREHWQHMNIPGQIANTAAARRSYSLSCPVDQASGNLSLLVRFMAGQDGRPPGIGSTYLYTLKEGDNVRFSGPFGDFAIQPGKREKVFIGGGAGMAPLRAMLRSLLEGCAQEPIHFWYGARTQVDVPYADEMAALAARYSNFKWNLVLSDAPAGSFVHEAARDGLLRTHPDVHACDFYLCGPPAMLEASCTMLEQLGVKRERVAFDDFKI